MTSEAQFKMKDIINQTSNLFPSRPSLNPPQKGWSPFKKFNVLRLKYSSSKPKKAKDTVEKKGELKTGLTHSHDIEDDLVILDISRDAVEEYNRTSRTRNPRQRLSRVVSCQSINKRVLAGPLPSRAKHFNVSTPDLLNLKQANIPETVDEVDAVSEIDTPSVGDADPFRYDGFLAEIINRFPKPPELDMDKTIRPRKPRETPRIRTGSVTSFSTTTTSTHCSNSSTIFSNCSSSTTGTSIQSHTRQISTTSMTSSQAPAPRQRKNSTESSYSIRTPTASRTLQTGPSKTATLHPSKPAYTFPGPSVAPPPTQYTDSNPPPVPPKDKHTRLPSNATEKLKWCSGDKENIVAAFPLEIYRMGCEMLGESVAMDMDMDFIEGLQAEVNGFINANADGKLLQRRPSDKDKGVIGKGKSGPIEGLRLNRKPRVLFKQPVVDAGSNTASGSEMLPPMKDA